MFKLIVLATIPVLLYSFVWVCLKFQLRRDIENSKIIILGDSQTKFISFKEIYNHSVDGSPYYVHYEFAKEFVNQIKGKKVYLACNFHNFSKLYQNRLMNENLMPGWRANTFQSLDKYKLLNYNHPEIRPNDLQYSIFEIKKILRFFKEVHCTSTNENNKKTVINDTLSIRKDIERHWRNPKYLLNDSIQTLYFDKLIRFLKNNNCKVSLLKMPLTNYYLDNVPEKIKKQVSALKSDYNVRLLDLNKELKISNNYNYFKDYGHLNKSGDSIVAGFFKEKVLFVY